MFFVFSSPRSGSTLLSQCLNAHSEVVVPHQTDFIVPLALIFNRIKDVRLGRRMMADLATKSNLSNSLREFLSTEEIENLIYTTDYHPGEIVDAIYQAIARKMNKQMAGDRSPNDLPHATRLAKAGVFVPGTKLIHLVRDIQDVMGSLCRLKWLPSTNLFFPRTWANDNLSFYHYFREQAEIYHLVRYEDFVREPESVLEKICAFLGLDFQEKMLSPDNRHSRYRTAEHHHGLFRPITTESIGKYQEALTTEQKAACVDHAREAIETFGYAGALSK